MFDLLAVSVPIEGLAAGLAVLVVACVKCGADIVKKKKNNGAMPRVWQAIEALTASVQTMQIMQAEDRTKLGAFEKTLEETHSDVRLLLRKEG